MKYSLDEKALILLDSFIHFDVRRIERIISLYESPSEIFDDIEPFESFVCENFNGNAKLFTSLINVEQADKVISELEKTCSAVICRCSDNYPERLRELDGAPICLYCKGNVELLDSENTVAIVGSRRTIPQTLREVEKYSNSLSETGVTIVTGVADGADRSAILGAIDRGRLICVLACGFNFICQETNRDLIEKIIEKGLVISELQPSVSQRAFNYPARNRIIAGLGDGVLIASGDFKSGARHTANAALEYGREVFAFPYNIDVRSGELCNSLIKDGAHLTDRVDDILEVLHIDGKVQEMRVYLSETELKIVEILSEGETHIDKILSVMNMRIFEISPILQALEIKRIIVRNSGNTYTLIK